MKVLFLVPPYITTDALVSFLYPMPLGPLSVAAYIREAGHEVSLKDFVACNENRSAIPPESFKGTGNPPYIHYGYDFDYIREWVKENVGKYDVIGITSLQAPIWEGTYELIKIVKQYTKKPIVLGGPHASSRPNEILEETGADSVVMGEGEIAFTELLKDLQEGRELKKIYTRELIEDLDVLPFPAWDLINFEDYPKAEGKLRAVFDTSRSCPHACTFCSVHTIWGRKWRAHSAKYVLGHVLHLYEKFGVRFFTFIDDNFLLNRERAVAILKGLIVLRKMKKLSGAKFLFEEGMQVVHAKDKELVRLLYEAGFTDLRLGLESFSEATLEYVKKPMVIKDFEEAIKVFNEVGYEPRVFYILGFKTDTVKSMVHNIIELSRYKINIRANNLKIYPNTDLAKEYLREGLIDEDYDWRMGTYFTPSANDFTMVEIKKLKSLLRVVEFCSTYKFNIFYDSLERISEVYEGLGYKIKYDNGNLYVDGYSTAWRADGMVKSCNKVLATRFGIENVDGKKLVDNKYIYFDSEQGKVYTTGLYNALKERDLIFKV